MIQNGFHVSEHLYVNLDGDDVRITKLAHDQEGAAILFETRISKSVWGSINKFLSAEATRQAAAAEAAAREVAELTAKEQAEPIAEYPQRKAAELAKAKAATESPPSVEPSVAPPAEPIDDEMFDEVGEPAVVEAEAPPAPAEEGSKEPF